MDNKAPGTPIMVLVVLVAPVPPRGTPLPTMETGKRRKAGTGNKNNAVVLVVAIVAGIVRCHTPPMAK